MTDYTLVDTDQIQAIWQDAINDTELWWYVGITSQGLEKGIDAEQAVKIRGYNHATDDRAGRTPDIIYYTDWIPGDLVDALEGGMVNELLSHPRTFNRIAAGRGHNSDASHGIVYLRLWSQEQEQPVVIQMDDTEPYTGEEILVPHCKHLWCTIATACLWAPFWACACCGCSTCKDPCPNTCNCCYDCCDSWNIVIPSRC